jgi:site-specific DNA-methyltransferase (adenine-specific)
MTEPFLECEFGTLYLGDSLDILKTLDDNSVDSVVTDPPYGLTNARPQVFKSVRDPSVNKGAKGFMGMEWDHGVPGPDYWAEAFRVAKPGAHMLAFGGTRTYHRLACAIEDAGWEIRDCIMWVYGSGFPKSLDIGKALDKSAGATRQVTGSRQGNVGIQGGNFGRSPLTGTILQYDDPVTENAKQWDGWGTALKPAWEPIIVARKPVEGSVSSNVLKYGTGAINVDESRVGTQGGTESVGDPNFKNQVYGKGMGGLGIVDGDKGRWPANLIHDGSEEVLEVFPDAPGQQFAVGPEHGDKKSINTFGDYGPRQQFEPRNDSGSAARFFYCAKASPSERGETNNHPTVKPQALMQYLCRLVTPPGGTVLDPFMGSGSTCLAAKETRFKFVGIDMTPKYCEIAKQRLITSEGIFGL